MSFTCAQSVPMVCVTKLGRITVEETRRFGPGPERPAQYPIYGRDE
jgi:hypothetical protein